MNADTTTTDDATTTDEPAALPVVLCPFCNHDALPLFSPINAYACESPTCGQVFDVEPKPRASVALVASVDGAPISSWVTDEDGNHLATITTEPTLPGVRAIDAYLLPEGLTFERWVDIVEHLQWTATSINWHLGDALVYGFDHWGDNAYQAVADQAMTALGRTDEWIEQIALVARAFPPDQRNFTNEQHGSRLRWSHFRAVMLRDLPSGDREALLAEAAAEGLPTRELGRRARGRANVIQGNVIDAPGISPDVPPEWQDDAPSAQHEPASGIVVGAVVTDAGVVNVVAKEDFERVVAEAAKEISAANVLLDEYRAVVVSLMNAEGARAGHMTTCHVGEAHPKFPDGRPCAAKCAAVRDLLGRDSERADGRASDA